MVELLFDKILIFLGDFFKLQGEFLEGIVGPPHLFEYAVGRLFQYLGPRVVVFVYPVAEAHESEGIVGILGTFDVVVDAMDVADFVQHSKHGFVGAAVGRSPKGTDTGGYRRKWIGLG